MKMDVTIYKIAIAGFLHDIGKFAERAGMNVIQEFIDWAVTEYCPKNEYQRNTHIHAAHTAAFIDHIEKLLPKEFNKGSWGIGDDFMNLAAGHHKLETPLQWIIAVADRVSSGFDRDEFEEYKAEFISYKKVRMLPLIEQVSIDGNWPSDNLSAYKFRYPLKEMSPVNIFPLPAQEAEPDDEKTAEKQYKDLFDEFIYSLEKLEHRETIPLWFEHFDSLFKIYASVIPSVTPSVKAGNIIPDISLYDHSKITSALASALYLYHQQTNSLDSVDKIKDYADQKFMLITGDFYGIQNFIFAEGGKTNKHSAKLLRGRSFAVSLISELAADMLCKEIGLPITSIILNAAGKFTILAPNTKAVKDIINSVGDKINEWLIKSYYGEVSLGISFIEASGDDFVCKRFSELWQRLSKSDEQKKYHKFNLEKYGGAVNDYLDSFDNSLDESLCPFCGKRPSSKEAENDKLLGEAKSACPICRDHIYLGANLVKSERIAVTTLDADIRGDKLLEPIFGQYQIAMYVTGKPVQPVKEGHLLKYWDISISEDGKISKDITAKFIGGYVPKYTKEDENDDRLIAGRKSAETKLQMIEMINESIPMSFHHLAQKSLNPIEDKNDEFCGIGALGILKADVDNLGLIFACGMKRPSLSRLAALSRQMDAYFTIYIPYILKTDDRFKDIYTVFTGGDDLFIIGPWNKIIDFAKFLNDKFKEYVCGKISITISCGISLNKPGESVSHLFENSETALNNSKKGQKDSVTLFGETVRWSGFSELSNIKDTLKGWYEEEIINNAMLFRLKDLAEMAKQEKMILESRQSVRMEDLNSLKWRALLSYSVARNVGKNIQDKQERAKAIEEVCLRLVDWLGKHNSLMKIPIWQIIYNYRKTGG